MIKILTSLLLILCLCLIAMTPPPPHMLNLLAQTSAASDPVPACLQIPLRPSWLLSAVISLCQFSTSASANHSSVLALTPRTHHQYDPSPGLQGAAPPPLIVLKTELYQDLISPGLPLATELISRFGVKEVLRETGTILSVLPPDFFQISIFSSFSKEHWLHFWLSTH